jgi:hypothetical protein
MRIKIVWDKYFWIWEIFQNYFWHIDFWRFLRGRCDKHNSLMLFLDCFVALNIKQ